MRRIFLCLVLLWGVGLGVPEGRTETGALMPKERNGLERVCLDCHRLPNVETNEGALANRALCQECHGKVECVREAGDKEVSLKVDPAAFSGTRHESIACIHCHRDVARSPHASPEGAQCGNCHAVHGERHAHAPHLRVRCQACHRAGARVERDAATGLVSLARADDSGNPVSLADHRMTTEYGDDFCRRCHKPGNKLGASVMVLPEKSFFCLVCHNAPLAMGPWIFWLVLAVLASGLVGMVSLWFRGNVSGEAESTHRKVALSSEAVWQTIFSRRILRLLKTLFFDVLLQRRILQESVERWSIHSLIYLAFLGRFFLSLLTLVLHNWNADGDWAMALVDKNHPFTAFVNDLLGIFILIGVAWALWRRLFVKPKHVLSEEQDTIALAIVGLLTLSGFALEGARILMSGVPTHTAFYSFGGWVVSRLWAAFGMDWQGGYGYLWYAHALLWAAFLVYLPFGKLKHVLTTPLTLLVRGQTAPDHQEN